jgi:pSer/pThr/pTyr-binding forkhead associated (FHA) protein
MRDGDLVSCFDSSEVGEQQLARGPQMIIIKSPGRTPLRLMVDEPIEIGRECHGLLLDDPLISRRHLEVSTRGGSLVVTDLGSTNGTTMGGRGVEGPITLVAGKVVAFGGSTLELL